MTGLSVLYANEATKERDWAAVPDRDRPGRLREVYWAHRGASKARRKPAVNVTLNWQLDRTAIGRRSDEPGDGFVFIVSMVPQVEEQIEWLEVTEVFTTVPASQIEGAMKVWNGIPDRHPIDFDIFRRRLKRGRPSRVEQRRASDRVIKQTESKLTKRSYTELLEKYGYGTLVVGMPLWFAVFPDDPFRAENAIDNFMCRTELGLEELRRRVLRRRDCPFKNVILVWDTTPEALREWRENKSLEYVDAANASLENPLGALLWELLPDAIERAVSEGRITESDTPSVSLHLYAWTNKKEPGKEPNPEMVEDLATAFRQGNKRPVGRWSYLKLNVSLTLCKLFCLVRINGLTGLKRWIAAKFSADYAWKKMVVRRRARRLYRESRRRGRVFRSVGHRDDTGEQGG